MSSSNKCKPISNMRQQERNSTKQDFRMHTHMCTPVSSTIKIEQILISSIIGSSEGGFRSRDERKWAEKM
jgi:hypothetical protein